MCPELESCQGKRQTFILGKKNHPMPFFTMALSSGGPMPSKLQDTLASAEDVPQDTPPPNLSCAPS